MRLPNKHLVDGYYIGNLKQEPFFLYDGEELKDLRYWHTKPMILNSIEKANRIINKLPVNIHKDYVIIKLIGNKMYVPNNKGGGTLYHTLKPIMNFEENKHRAYLAFLSLLNNKQLEKHLNKKGIVIKCEYEETETVKPNTKKVAAQMSIL